MSDSHPAPLHKTLLIVDDERDIAGLIEDALRAEGFAQPLKAYKGSEAISLCRAHSPHAVILDVMLPDMDGFEVCRQIRQFSQVPVLFLSCKNDEVDKILGLAIGGDDYITKPFSPRELVYRVKAQLRRIALIQASHPYESQKLDIGPLAIHRDACQVTKGGIEVALTAREYALLLYLGENAGKIISKERLYEQVWGEDSTGCDNTIMVHIRHLREKVEDDPSYPRLIVTVKGLGYKLVKAYA